MSRKQNTSKTADSANKGWSSQWETEACAVWGDSEQFEKKAFFKKKSLTLLFILKYILDN